MPWITSDGKLVGMGKLMFISESKLLISPSMAFGAERASKSLAMFDGSIVPEVISKPEILFSGGFEANVSKRTLGGLIFSTRLETDSRLGGTEPILNIMLVIAVPVGFIIPFSRFVSESRPARKSPWLTTGVGVGRGVENSEALGTPTLEKKLPRPDSKRPGVEILTGDSGRLVGGNISEVSSAPERRPSVGAPAFRLVNKFGRRPATLLALESITDETVEGSLPSGMPRAERAPASKPISGVAD